jgi:membrane-bound lytic murein transglycosylase D
MSLNRFALAVVVLALSVSAHAADQTAGLQSLQWLPATSLEPAAPDDADAAATADVWQRIRDGFKFDASAEQNPLVSAQTAWYAARPDYVRRIVERARRYLYHIVQEVDRRAMPTEIALLPMIESAFNPSALSPSDASGIWQFVPATGRLYGLKQNTWYDGRRDFTAATSAALDYLGKLYLDFGDWQLALAAYNCGEGCVARAIQKNVAQGLPTDYASLPLPAETRNYVPKLLAMKALVREPEKFGLALAPLPNAPYFDQVTVRVASIDVQSAARLAGMSRDEFLALNAAFPRKLIRSDTPVNLLVPAGKADDFERKLQSGDWDSWQPYTVQRGERPDAVAKRLGVDVERLQSHNQFHLKRGKFAQTQTILVPVKGRAAAVTSTAEPEATSSYVVQRGDTLFGIARNRGLTVAQINAANPQLDGAIQPGQTLRLPAGTEPDTLSEEPSPVHKVAFKPRAAKAATPQHYKVRRGDTLHAIADRYDVSLAELKSWNPGLRKVSAIRPGQRIVVRQH